MTNRRSDLAQKYYNKNYYHLSEEITFEMHSKMFGFCMKCIYVTLNKYGDHRSPSLVLTMLKSDSFYSAFSFEVIEHVDLIDEYAFN